MLLVVSEMLDGVWVQLEGETAAEMQALEQSGGAKGQRPSGPGLDGIPRRHELAGGLGYTVRVVRR